MTWISVFGRGPGPPECGGFAPTPPPLRSSGPNIPHDRTRESACRHVSLPALTPPAHADLLVFHVLTMRDISLTCVPTGSSGVDPGGGRAGASGFCTGLGRI